jgi:serine/threonine protein kinase
VSYCINPWCHERENTVDSITCYSCGTPLLINGRIRLIKPLRSLDPLYRTEIFEVEDRGTQFQEYSPGTRRVMKILKSQDPKVIDLFEREELVLRVLDHPAIPRVTIDDCFTFKLDHEYGELRCLVMQKFEGENLEDWVETHGRISQSMALSWLHQLVDILDHVHQSGFFHRDIKPSNIVLQDNGQLALVDFGTVREVSNTYLARVSAVGKVDRGLGKRFGITVVRSAGYSPIEQIEGQSVPQSDFYALGRTLTYLMTGINPIYLPASQNLRRLSWRDSAPQIDKPFADFIDWLMAPTPGKRPQNTQIILDYLENRFKLKFFLKLARLKSLRSFKFGFLFLSIILFVGVFQTALFFNTRYQTIQSHEQANDYFELGVKRHVQGHAEAARSAYEQSLKLNPQSIDTLEYLALICQNLKDRDCTLKSYKRLLDLAPNSWKGHYNLGVFWDGQGEWKKAESEYKLALSFPSPIRSNVLSRLSRLKNSEGDYKSAEKYALLALDTLKSQDPTDVVTQAMLEKDLGWAAFGQKRFHQAELNLMRSLELDPLRIDSKCLLTKVFVAQSRVDEAKKAGEECLQSDYSSPEVSKWRLDVIRYLLRR